MNRFLDDSGIREIFVSCMSFAMNLEGGANALVGFVDLIARLTAKSWPISVKAAVALVVWLSCGSPQL